MKDKGRAENGTEPAVNIKIFLPPVVIGLCNVIKNTNVYTLMTVARETP